MTRILVTGRNGQVGAELVNALTPHGEVTALDRPALDLTNESALRATVRSVAPQIIVNAAAYTAVDRAESERELAFAVNATAPGILAEEAQRCGAWLIHYSTDYVFDGSKAAPYVEEDTTRPLNVYGESKLAGEHAVQAGCGKHVILRTSWVYGARGKNFFLTIRKLAQERDELKIVDDQVGAPTWCRDIANATAQIIGQLQKVDAPEKSGVYHLSAEGRTSWYGFAAAIVAETCEDRKPRLTPIPSAQYPTPAARPRNSVLSHEKLQRAFGVVLPDWRASLTTCARSSA